MNVECILKDMRICFCEDLVVAKAFRDGDKARFTSWFIMDPKSPAAKLSIDTVAVIAKAEFRGKAPEGDQCALREGDEAVNKDGEVYDGLEGNIYISAARTEKQGPPLVVGLKASAGAIGMRDPQFPKAGDYVNAKVQFFSIGGKNDKATTFKPSICCSLVTVQFLRKGVSLAGGAANADGLDDIEEEVDELSLLG